MFPKHISPLILLFFLLESYILVTNQRVCLVRRPSRSVHVDCMDEHSHDQHRNKYGTFCTCQSLHILHQRNDVLSFFMRLIKGDTQIPGYPMRIPSVLGHFLAQVAMLNCFSFLVFFFLSDTSNSSLH